jgi:hypothetical protein
MNKKGMFNNSNIGMEVFKGFLCSFTLLILPILWVLNWVIGIKYFYFYPIGIIFMRFIRYVGMIILYSISSEEFKDNCSDNLKEEFNNIKNYSPSWSLFGIDLLKTIMNIQGYNNEFSEMFINKNNKKNLSNDKYFTSLIFLRLFLSDNIMDELSTNGKKYFIILGLTIIIGSIFLYFLKVQDVKEESYKN